LLLLIACNKDMAINNAIDTAKPTLQLVNSYPLNIEEPSGLSLYHHHQLLCVDDHTNAIFVIDTCGNIKQELNYIGLDLEGISYDPQSKIVYIVYEQEHRLLAIDTAGIELNHWIIPFVGGENNKGFEGLAIDQTNQRLFILNEASPGKLIEWDIASQIINKQTELTFALDYSGAYFCNTDSSLWILSDQSQKLFHISSSSQVLSSFDLKFDKAEGIAVDETNQLIYIVRDTKETNKLYIYKLVE